MSIAEKLTQIAENEQRVYEAGKTKVLKAVQKNGSRVNYERAFHNWDTTGLLYPVYDIKPTRMDYLFTSAITEAIDFAQRLEDCGVILDTSRCVPTASAPSPMSWAFYATKFTRLPVIDFSGGAKADNIFHNMPNLVTIDKIIVTESTTYTSTFTLDSALEKLTVEGTIGQNGFNVQWSTKLNKASITSIINALSRTTSGLAITLSKTAVNKAFGINVDDETTYSEGSEYYTLRHSKDNWTINYI